MRFKVKRIVLIFVLFVFPIIVFAQGESVSISCEKKEFSQDDKVNCILKGSSKKITTSLDMLLSSDSELEISNIELLSDWQGIEDNHIELYTDQDMKDEFEIVSFNLAANSSGNYKVYVKNIKFYDDSFEENKVDDYEILFSVSPGTGKISNKTKKSNDNVIDDLNYSSSNKNYIYIVMAVLSIVIIAVALYLFKNNKKAKNKN